MKKEEVSIEIIESQYKKLISYAKEYFTEDRYQKTIKLFEHFGDRFLLCPASSKINYYNCYPGGLLDYIISVIEFGLKFHDFINSTQINIPVTYTKEELVFVCIFHYIGKVGDINESYYVEEESVWHQQNQGRLYNINNNIRYMTVLDRSLHLLQQFKFNLSEVEYLGIKLCEGQFTSYAQSYAQINDYAKSIKTNLPFVMFQILKNIILFKKIEKFESVTEKLEELKDSKKTLKEVNANKEELENLYNSIFNYE